MIGTVLFKKMYIPGHCGRQGWSPCFPGTQSAGGKKGKDVVERKEWVPQWHSVAWQPRLQGATRMTHCPVLLALGLQPGFASSETTLGFQIHISFACLFLQGWSSSSNSNNSDWHSILYLLPSASISVKQQEQTFKKNSLECNLHTIVDSVLVGYIAISNILLSDQDKNN